MKPYVRFLPLFILNLAVGYSSAGTATLYDITTIDPLTTSLPYKVIQESGTTIVRVIGTGADGKTTYVQDNIVSLFVAQIPAPNAAQPAAVTTQTLISIPQTIQVTFAEDKDGYHATRSISVLSPSGSPLSYQAGLDEKCVFNADGTGSCVRVDMVLDINRQTELSTTTYSGRLVPWYTVSGPSDSQVPSATGNSAKGMIMKDGSSLGLFGMMAGVSISVLSGLRLLGFGIW